MVDGSVLNRCGGPAAAASVLVSAISVDTPGCRVRSLDLLLTLCCDGRSQLKVSVRLRNLGTSRLRRRLTGGRASPAFTGPAAAMPRCGARPAVREEGGREGIECYRRLPIAREAAAAYRPR